MARGAPRVPAIGPTVPRRRNPLTRAFGRLLLHLLDWRIVGDVPDYAKFVAVAGPHTSGWDLIVALAVIWSLDVRVSWMGKHTLFGAWTGWFFRALGGVPVNRSAPHGIVTQIAGEFARRDALVLALAPEGTRTQVARWKTGFHRIARAAGVPIVSATLDFPSRTVRIGPLLWPGDDMKADILALRTVMYSSQGFHPRTVAVAEPEEQDG